ncbi:MAG: hypothetical protein AAFX04_02375 [Pseudomonadota bacterium]
MPLTESRNDAGPLTSVGRASQHAAITTSRKAFEEALNMVEVLADAAGDQAEDNARRARDLGNHIHFCHWREVRRIIATLGARTISGTVN